MNSSSIVNSVLGPTIPERFSPDEKFEYFRKAHCTLLKKGTSRKVYAIEGTEYVLKVAISKETIVCNWTEIVAYHALDAKLSLALVFSWSNSGKYLVMEKLDMTNQPCPSFTWPSWVTDRKPSNIGTDRNGSPKLCDYAFIKLSEFCGGSSFA